MILLEFKEGLGRAYARELIGRPQVEEMIREADRTARTVERLVEPEGCKVIVWHKTHSWALFGYAHDGHDAVNARDRAKRAWTERMLGLKARRRLPAGVR